MTGLVSRRPAPVRRLGSKRARAVISSTSTCRVAGDEQACDRWKWRGAGPDRALGSEAGLLEAQQESGPSAWVPGEGPAGRPGPGLPLGPAWEQFLYQAEEFGLKESQQIFLSR